VQQALVDGQTSFVLLCGFCAFIRLRTSGQDAAPLVLLSWSWKVQLFPAVLLALVLDRRWRYAVGLVVAQALVVGIVVWWAGSDVLQRYIDFARWSTDQTTARLSPPGQTLLGLMQSVSGVGTVPTLTAIIGCGIVALVLASVWLRGLTSDSRQHVQLALLPIAAVLTATHAGTYELTIWLASGWLLIHYARDVPRHRFFALAIVFFGWWGGDLASLAERTTGFEWGAVAGLAAFIALVCMVRTHASDDKHLELWAAR
jgi:hypothetical protein